MWRSFIVRWVPSRYYFFIFSPHSFFDIPSILLLVHFNRWERSCRSICPCKLFGTPLAVTKKKKATTTTTTTTTATAVKSLGADGPPRRLLPLLLPLLQEEEEEVAGIRMQCHRTTCWQAPPTAAATCGYGHRSACASCPTGRLMGPYALLCATCGR